MFPSQRQALNTDRMLWSCKVKIMSPRVANSIRMGPVKFLLSKPLAHRKWPWLVLENNRPGEKFSNAQNKDTLAEKKKD